MRTKIYSLVVPSLMVVTPVGAQEGFQGTVTYRLSADGEERTMYYMGLGAMVRQELESEDRPRGQMFVLLDTDDWTVRVVMPGRSLYTETSLGGAAGGGGGSLTRLGTSDVVAGVGCDNYLIEDVQTFEVCIATGMGWLMTLLQASDKDDESRGPNFSAHRAQFADGLLPLRSTRVKGGKRELLMEATSVERTALDPGLFEVPAGFRRMGGDD